MSRTPHKLANLHNTPIPPAPEVSLAVVTHCPSGDAWYAQHPDVVKMCLDSMLAGVDGIKYELLIWDDSSTPEFRQMLKSYSPDVYIEGVNTGAVNARRALGYIARAPILCLTDDDILFSHDWLRQQLELLTTYPNVGLVSGCPHHVAFDIRKAREETIAWALNEPECRVWNGTILTPEQWEDDFCISINRLPGHYEDRGDISLEDWLLEYKGVKAWAHGHHMQFLAYAETIRPYLIPNGFMLQYDYINSRVADDGYLELTTFDRTCHHIGNVIDETVLRAQAVMSHSHAPPEFDLPKWTK